MGCSLRSVYYLVTVRESEGKVKFEMLRFWRILLLVRESFKLPTDHHHTSIVSVNKFTKKTD